LIFGRFGVGRFGVVHELNVENEVRIRRNYAAKAACAISHVGGDGEFPFLALDHIEEAFVPAFDNLANADNHTERAATGIARGVKLCTVFEFSGVMDNDSIILLGFGE